MDDAELMIGKNSVDDDNNAAAEKEIDEMKRRVKEMEEEAEKLREMQAAELAKQSSQDGEQGPMDTEEPADNRSIYIGNVDYSATPEEIQQHFQSCGIINRVTILCDKFTGHPKGYAYVEYAQSDSIDAALELNNSLFKGRLIKVTRKRTNVPGYGRGRGYRGGYRGGFRGGERYNPYRARGRGRGRGF